MTEPQDIASLYRDIFEHDKRGQQILEDLIKRFGAARTNSSGIDRVLDTQEFMGRRKVLDYIALRINQANGVNDPQPEGEPNE